jgi:hypothetical protein
VSAAEDRAERMAALGMLRALRDHGVEQRRWPAVWAQMLGIAAGREPEESAVGGIGDMVDDRPIDALEGRR